MSLTLNHNVMAMNASRNLSDVYHRLTVSTMRLSSGLRINSAVDDAAGLAIRELMRTDIIVTRQGIRNAADGVSLIQTAEGALSVIDEKLIRMKELSEQAATGTYTTTQREILNSEYQAMAAEIDRIANATEFNGIKLLDGSVTDFHAGTGLKIHFGSLNLSAEDYYFVKIGDVRATSATGLRVGGDALNDIRGQRKISGTGVARLDSVIVSHSASAGAFLYHYNFLGDPSLSSASIQAPSFLAGIYREDSGATLQDLINAINRGTASRVQINFNGGNISDLHLGSGGVFNLCFGDEVFQLGSGLANAAPISGKIFHYVNISGLGTSDAATVVASALSNSSLSLMGIASATANRLMVFFRNGGDNNQVLACDYGSATAASQVSWTNVQTGDTRNGGVNFSLGGQNWAKADYFQRDGLYYLDLEGTGRGEHFDLVVGSAGVYNLSAIAYFTPIYFQETQNASFGNWAGAQIRTQSHAQEALDAINQALNHKDIVRANLGALQNRLENTMTNMDIQAENLQASESRISDVDIATEMTEYSRNNIMAQVGAAMLAQANSIPKLALTLLS